MSKLVDEANSIAAKSGNIQPAPAIMKELIHYQIFTSLQENGFLTKLVFQGGTSLHLCYNAPRLSEDLDFSGGRDFDASQFSDLAQCLQDTVTSALNLETVVRPPKSLDRLVKTWRILVTIDPEHSDIPRQKVKIDIASIDAHDIRIEQVTTQFDHNRLHRTALLTPVESLEEILADKVQAFVCSDYMRLRDVWDMGWILSQPDIDLDKVAQLRKFKDADYQEKQIYASKFPSRRRELRTVLDNASYGELAHFLPDQVLAETIGNNMWRTWINQKINTLLDICKPQQVRTQKHSGLSR